MLRITPLSARSAAPLMAADRALATKVKSSSRDRSGSAFDFGDFLRRKF